MAPAHDAAVCGNLDWFRAAFTNGENVNTPNDVRPLCRGRSVNLFALALVRGGEADLPISHARVHLAVLARTFLLLSVSSCPDPTKKQVGWTPLHIAAYTGCWDLVQLLLEHDADVTLADRVRHAFLSPRV